MPGGRGVIYWRDHHITLHIGDVLQVLADIPSASVQAIVTSPPFWGLRDYGIPPSIWGGARRCAHAWGSGMRSKAKDSRRASMLWSTGGQPGKKTAGKAVAQGAFCECGAWRGSLGLEPTIALYVEHISELFTELWRVLRPDGTAWVEWGDTYNSPNTHSGPADKVDWALDRVLDAGANSKGTTRELRPKNLAGIPWRCALTLQAAGWNLRSEIIWSRPNPMPESAGDRPTKSHSTIFLLTKKPRYFYDAAAVREAHAEPERSTGRVESRVTGRAVAAGANNGFGLVGQKARAYNPLGRNMRSVWSLPTQACPEAHFATWPEEIARRCIVAGTPAHGSCSECGAPRQPDGTGSCKCNALSVPAVVLDPFCGSGTTPLVARANFRRAIGIEIKQEYCDIAVARWRQHVLPFGLEGERG